MVKVGIGCTIVLALFVTGCPGSGGGAARLDTSKVTGKVTMNGAPVPGASVTFSPSSTGKPAAMGLTDTQGVYVLTTYDSGDGAVPGDYKVLVSKSAPAAGGGGGAPTHDPTGKGGASAAPQHSGPARGAAAGGGSLLPAKYASAATTTLTKTVVDGANTLDIEL